jgi:hypothetical protein
LCIRADDSPHPPSTTDSCCTIPEQTPPWISLFLSQFYKEQMNMASSSHWIPRVILCNMPRK